MATKVLELRAIDEQASLGSMASDVGPTVEKFAAHLSGDIRRELVEFVEAPKPTEGLIPDTPYVQLRHVEVKPQQMAAYRQWRENTIFNVVRDSGAVEIFLAYHSVVSGYPGVMFVSGYSVDPDTYGEVFASERYKEIVRTASETYITGGTEGLYTRTYRNQSAIAA